MDFGIYETVTIDEIPEFILDSFHNYPIRLEANTESSIIGYISKADLPVFDFPMYKANLKFLRTIYPVDRNGEYFAVVAVKNKPAIVNSDIKNQMNFFRIQESWV